jgi:hypothetical protein
MLAESECLRLAEDGYTLAAEAHGTESLVVPAGLTSRSISPRLAPWPPIPWLPVW